jgi:hypothetical protein
MWRGREGRRGKNACSILVGKSEGTRPLGILRRTWVDNIELSLGIDWIDLTEDRRTLCQHGNKLSDSI